jgi:hypothetical protein
MLRKIHLRAISSVHCNVSTRNVLVLVLIYTDSLNMLIYSRCTVTLAYSVLCIVVTVVEGIP